MTCRYVISLSVHGEKADVARHTSNLPLSEPLLIFRFLRAGWLQGHGKESGILSSANRDTLAVSSPRFKGRRCKLYSFFFRVLILQD